MWMRPESDLRKPSGTASSAEKIGQTAECEMHFGDVAVGAKVAYAEGEGGIELRGIEQA